MGRARAVAVRDQVGAQSQEDDGVSRLRSVRATLTVARKRGTDAYLMVLAGGDAGLRLGKSSRSNGAISTCRRAVPPCSDPTGSDTLRCPKGDDRVSSRSRSA